MITVHTLASGSSGNALLLSDENSHLLVDTGISCRRITASLRELGLVPEQLDAILITHTHTDHISGLQTLLKHTAAPICSSERVCRELAWRFAGMEDRLWRLEFCCKAELNAWHITPFPVAHDAPGACGYRFDRGGCSVGVMTDTGYVTPEAERILPGVDCAVLEANHDVDTLLSGPYPYYLKQRILGREGHLCNEDAARFAVTLAESGAARILLAHLSHENNTPAMAHNAVERALSAAGLSPELAVAPRSSLSEAFFVCRRKICKE